VSGRVTLDDIVSPTADPRKKGCAICGADNAAMVMVRIQRLGANGSISGRTGESKSRALSFCAEHAVEMWQSLNERLGSR
jgi:hypothetical protein